MTTFDAGWWYGFERVNISARVPQAHQKAGIYFKDVDRAVAGWLMGIEARGLATNDPWFLGLIRGILAAQRMLNNQVFIRMYP